MKRKICFIIFILLFFMFLGLYLVNKVTWFDDFFYNNIINIKSDTVTKFMKIITFFASTKFVILFMFISLVFYIVKRNRIYFIFDIIILFEVLINNITKLIIGRERPILINLVTETSYSFPSGHTMVAVVLYGFLIYLINKSMINNYLKVLFSILFSILIILIMLSRIYLGVHFASDVFAGMSLSIAYLIFMIDYLERRKML